ncbi:septum formation initiator family protein [Baekduia soli]|uniref:Septum formation initiator family protein n=1 Tax=Baekduia soli TaxID=496014 RepID=A0A5B8U383_9ACTN|nr:septum formation initiator family protein [Baekduia soli]QEC47504.1 septum formation initiator family protein [Baekduia soli]
MASARQSAAARERTRPRPDPPSRRPRAIPGGARGIRWDRVGRVALLIVLFGVVALYVGPSISFFHTYRDAQARRAEVRQLQHENERLRARRKALQDPRTLEREARRLGLVKPGERPYIVKGLPGDR